MGMNKPNISKKAALKARAEALLTRSWQQEEKGEFLSAFRCLLSGAKLGDTGCQINLGNYYDDGKVVKRNREAALYWYKRAIKKGEGPGAHNTGILYRTEGDFDRALFWFKRAVALGDVEANLWIAKVLIEDKKEPKLAARHLKLVCKAKPYAEVSFDGHHEAARLLRKLARLSTSN
jgi:TPR repeat protein